MVQPPEAAEPDPSLFERRTPGERPSRTVETWSAILLSVTVILTAWSAFESSKWGGAMSIAFSQASSARVQANLAAIQASQALQADLTIYTTWVQLKAAKNEPAAAYVTQRFTPRFRVVFDQWVALGGLTDPTKAPPSPFALASYVPPGTQEQAALDARANAKYVEALRNNQRGDNYTLLGVLFALVLFFAAMATRFANRRLQLGMLAFASVAFLLGVVFLISFPKLI